MYFRLVRALTILALLVGCSTIEPEEHSATAQEPTGQLLINQGRESSIVELDIVSGQVRQITGNGELAATARWSPDDRYIVMAQQVVGAIRIVVVDAEGELVTIIKAPTGVDEGVPTWSPDCRSFAVGRFSPDSADAWMVSLDGGSSQRLGGPAHVTGFDWSEASGRIAMFRLAQPFGSRSDDADTHLGDVSQLDNPELVGILTMRSDGSEVEVVAGTIAGDEWPRWSPDGTTLAFDREVDGTRQVFVVDGDANVTQLTDGDDGARSPIWSPAGDWLAYRTGDAATGTISLMRVDGSEQRDLTTNGTPTDWGPHKGSCPQIAGSSAGLVDRGAMLDAVHDH